MGREWRAGTDTGFGLAVTTTVLGFVGAGLMLAGAGEALAGWGFALAVVGGILAIAAVHLAPA